MMVVAQLGNNEQVLPLHNSSSNQLLYALPYSFLIAIHFGIINMLQARQQMMPDAEFSRMMRWNAEVPKVYQVKMLVFAEWYNNMTQQS